LNNQANQVKQTNTILIFALLAAFGAYFISVYLLIYRRTLRSIAKLQEGTRIIGSGKLDYSIAQQSNDEIGELSHAFKQMTSNLKNVTTSKEDLEKIVAERTKQLKDSERLAAIGATAGMVGHDIRNPLQAITSDVYLAKTELENIPESEEKKNALESLGEIEKNVDYINKIVQDLQDYARPLNPKVEESNLRQIVEALFAKNGLPENVEVNVEVAEGTRKIRVDAYYLNRILFNLVTNAVQAMPQGGKLTVRAYKEENDTVITVSDTGVGIPQAIQEKMFTLMFTTKAKGQGFGLPVVKRMTESLGGTVTFESKEGKGTTFTVRLPPAQGAKR
jgi:two-component system sensor histidine kinase AtoS